jgi:hypothetical protein
VDATYCHCPVCVDQQHHFVVSWGGKVYVNHCITFCGTSLAGVFGHVADTFLAICCAQGWLPCTKWVNDFVFIRHLLGTASLASLLCIWHQGHPATWPGLRLALEGFKDKAIQPGLPLPGLPMVASRPLCINPRRKEGQVLGTPSLVDSGHPPVVLGSQSDTQHPCPLRTCTARRQVPLRLSLPLCCHPLFCCLLLHLLVAQPAPPL